MVSFSSVSQCIAMCLMVSTIMPSALAAPSPENKSSIGVAVEIASLLSAAASSGLIKTLAPDVIAKIKAGDFSEIPAGILDELKSKIPGNSSNGRIVIPSGCSFPSVRPSGTGPVPMHTQKDHDLD